ncbi:unnamed protein product [Rangifer tarandus platyrhynchus]|uniref:Uncharacterized protein n=2 Tax=Rangifer tarandus platyrhynchus TaxID=3082113 RepID=A0ABN8YE87_RANTA|nr:unnamed protein product [Rangifer tarandus platyrhynchus]
MSWVEAGHHVVNFFHLVGVSVSTRQLTGRGSECCLLAVEQELKVLDYALNEDVVIVWSPLFFVFACSHFSNKRILCLEFFMDKSLAEHLWARALGSCCLTVSLARGVRCG